MTYPIDFQNEGFSVVKPPFSNGIGFNYWKTRMNCFVKSIDYDLWYIVMNRDIIPKKKVEDRWVVKTQDDFDDRDKIMISKNTRAKYYLICGLDRNIFNSVDQAYTAPEMWRMLEVTHQGTSSMKEIKINILVQQMKCSRYLVVKKLHKYLLGSP